MNKESKSEIKVFVVDDSDYTRKEVVKVLDEEGYNVIGEASNAVDALKLAVNNPPDIFLIDVVMPEIGGIELAKKITDQQLGSKIIMMSSLRLDNVVIESISSGACDFISKPFEKDDITKSVEKIAQQIANNR